MEITTCERPVLSKRLRRALHCAAGLLLLGTVWQTSNAAVAEPQRLSLWPNGAPQKNSTNEAVEVPITVYLPDATNATGTAMVICPGGGYAGLVTGAEGHGIARWLGQHGIAGVVLEYRLPRHRPFVPLMDAQRAIRTTRFHARDWHLRPDRIGIIGFSAGGHLASTALTHFDTGTPQATDPIERVSSRPDFGVLIYPVITLGEKTHHGTRNNLLGSNPKPDLVKLFSNDLQVTDRTPPTFLAHALDDTLVPPDNSRMFFEALQAHQVPGKFLELPHGGHGLNGYSGPMWTAWQTGCLDWLKSIKRLP